MSKHFSWAGLALAAAGSVFTGASSAAVVLLVDNSGLLIGANGVNVNGTLYDVSFGDGSANVLSIFTTSTTALAASSALDAQVFGTFTGQTWDGSSYGSLTNETKYDLSPTLTRGCPDISTSTTIQATRFCAIWTIYGVTSSTSSFAIVRNQVSAADLVLTSAIGTPYDTGSGPFRTIATWRAHQALSTIPEPATLGTVMLSLGLMAGLSRRRRKAA